MEICYLSFIEDWKYITLEYKVAVFRNSLLTCLYIAYSEAEIIHELCSHYFRQIHFMHYYNLAAIKYKIIVPHLIN